MFSEATMQLWGNIAYSYNEKDDDSRNEVFFKRPENIVIEESSSGKDISPVQIPGKVEVQSKITSPKTSERPEPAVETWKKIQKTNSQLVSVGPKSTKEVKVTKKHTSPHKLNESTKFANPLTGNKLTASQVRQLGAQVAHVNKNQGGRGYLHTENQETGRKADKFKVSIQPGEVRITYVQVNKDGSEIESNKPLVIKGDLPKEQTVPQVAKDIRSQFVSTADILTQAGDNASTIPPTTSDSGWRDGYDQHTANEFIKDQAVAKILKPKAVAEKKPDGTVVLNKEANPLRLHQILQPVGYATVEHKGRTFLAQPKTEKEGEVAWYVSAGPKKGQPIYISAGTEVKPITQEEYERFKSLSISPDPKKDPMKFVKYIKDKAKAGIPLTREDIRKLGGVENQFQPFAQNRHGRDCTAVPALVASVVHDYRTDIATIPTHVLDKGLRETAYAFAEEKLVSKGIHPSYRYNAKRFGRNVLEPMGWEKMNKEQAKKYFEAVENGKEPFRNLVVVYEGGRKSSAKGKQHPGHIGIVAKSTIDGKYHVLSDGNDGASPKLPNIMHVVNRWDKRYYGGVSFYLMPKKDKIKPMYDIAIPDIPSRSIG